MDQIQALQQKLALRGDLIDGMWAEIGGLRARIAELETALNAATEGTSNGSGNPVEVIEV